jgi:hypothetical protein
MMADYGFVEYDIGDESWNADLKKRLQAHYFWHLLLDTVYAIPSLQKIHNRRFQICIVTSLYRTML